MSVVFIYNRIAIAIGIKGRTENEAGCAAAHLCAPRRFIQVLQGESDHRSSASERTFRPPSISAVEDFCGRLSQEMESHDPATVCVIHTGSDSRSAIMHACVMVGAYLMLRTGLGLDDVVEAFRSIQDDLKAVPADSSEGQHAVGVANCWAALDQALRLGWLVGPSSHAEPLLDVEEFAHYAHPANGRVHMLAPGSLFFLPAPEHLAGGLAWADTAPGAAPCRAVERRFSPAFCADLLADLGASAVLSLDAVPPSAARAYAARGMAVVGARAGRGLPSPLAALDALLTAAGGGRGGAVAVTVAGLGGAGGGGPGWLGPLAAAFLVGRHGFPAGAAVAWAHMLCPWMFGGADAPPQ